MHTTLWRNSGNNMMRNKYIVNIWPFVLAGKTDHAITNTVLSCNKRGKFDTWGPHQGAHPSFTLVTSYS